MTQGESQERRHTRPRYAPKPDLPTKRRRKHGGGRPAPRRDNRKSRYDADYTGEDEKHNADFEAYYREQNIVPEDEFATLIKTFTIPLPTSFRVTSDSAFRNNIQETLHGEMTDLFQKVAKQACQEGTDPLKPLSQLPWYPDGLAWTVSAPRQMLRRDNVLSPFHKFIVRMNDIGAINRQEAVSMIPTLMLDIQEGHSVVDLCAAPGSKTAQILESVSNRKKSLPSEGVVIANDAELRRCWMLTHQLKRFSSAELVVTHHDAQHFPKFMSFDRVLCDVPCSGDGTLRKAPDMWRRWNSNMGFALHRLQRQIVERGIDILKPGGRLVYSTCSMNPIENEAIVAHVLRAYGDQMELVDCFDMLPGLIRRPGLKTWLVKDNSGKSPGGGTAERTAYRKDGGEYEVTKTENEDVVGRKQGWFCSFNDVPMRRRDKIVKSLFPPSVDELESGKFPLERCMRLLPHDQDTGAFFVSVFKKVDSAKLSRKLRAKGEPKLEQEVTENHDTGMVDKRSMEDNKLLSQNVKQENEVVTSAMEADEGHSFQTQESKLKAEDVVSASADEPRNQSIVRASRLIMDDPLVEVREMCSGTLDKLIEFFGLDREVMELNLMTRGTDKKSFKRIVRVSQTARNVLCKAVGAHIRGAGVRPERQVVRVVNAGVRVLERTDRNDSSCCFRLIHDGVGMMRNMMSQRVITEGVVKSEMVRLLREKNVRLQGENWVAGMGGVEEENANAFWERVIAIGSGSAVIVCEEEEVIVWVGKRAVNVVMTKEVIDALLMRFGFCPSSIDVLER